MFSEGGLKSAIGSMYARKHFPVEYKRDAEAIAETVKKVTTVCPRSLGPFN